MTVSATELRKNLSALLERVVRGETIRVRFRGSLILLSAAQVGSKLARAKRQATLLCDPDSFVSSDRELLAPMPTAWHRDWNML